MTAIVALPDAWDPAVQREIQALAPPELELRFGDLDALSDARFLIAATRPVTAETIASAPHLRLIHKWGVGLDTVAVDAARDAGVGIAVTTAANAHAVAEHTVMLMLAALRQVSYAHRSTDGGRWVFSEMRGRARQLSGRTVGIVGFGNIGTAVAQRLAGFDVELLFHDPVRPDPETERRLNATAVGFDELLARTDLLTLHCPGGAANHHLISTDELAAMPAGGHVVNTARGDVLDTTALIAALDSGHLLGAGLDVFEDEPLAPDHPLVGRDDVTLTPHAAGSVLDNVARVARHCFDNLLRVLRDEPLPAADEIVAPSPGR